MIKYLNFFIKRIAFFFLMIEYKFLEIFRNASNILKKILVNKLVLVFFLIVSNFENYKLM